MLSVHKDSSPRSFSQWIRPQISSSMLIHGNVAGNTITFPLHCHHVPHTYFTQCNAAGVPCVIYTLIIMGFMEYWNIL